MSSLRTSGAAVDAESERGMKFHLLSTEEPAHDHQLLTALCGTLVPDAMFVFHFDTGVCDFRESVNPLRTCAGCREASMETSSLKRYVYGLVAGDEMIHQMGGAA